MAWASRARDARQGRRAPSSYRWIIGTVVLDLLSWISGSPGLAEEISQEQMQSLDEQVQVIKSDVLGIAAELNRLEERLLYPSNTQLAVFVELGAEEDFRLDAVKIEIDGARLMARQCAWRKSQGEHLGALPGAQLGDGLLLLGAQAEFPRNPGVHFIGRSGRSGRRRSRGGGGERKASQQGEPEDT